MVSIAVAALATAYAMPRVLGARSCTSQGQVHVPCDDQLVLEPTEKFLLTLMGHGCYDVALRSSVPLDVIFYETQGSLYAWRLREMQAIDPDIELLGDSHDDIAAAAAASLPSQQAANASVSALHSNRTTASTNLCDSSRVCRRSMRGLSRRGVYNLVVAYSRDHVDAAALTSSDGITLSLESCDEGSMSSMISLLVVGCMGFASALLCLCLLGEYVLGLRSVTKCRRSIERRHQFIELTQVESPLKDAAFVSCEDRDAVDARLLSPSADEALASTASPTAGTTGSSA